MDYNDINNKWKLFLAENTFKEDKLVNPKKKKKKKHKEDGKEIIVSDKQKCMDEGSDCMEERNENYGSFANSGSNTSEGYAENALEEDQLEEMSGMSGGAVAGYAANAFGDVPFKRKKPRKQWG
jgi:hypothetical protein